jgi:WD40 repeat protein/cytochrome c-type biogenesis protein CcmH/NrfG
MQNNLSQVYRARIWLGDSLDRLKNTPESEAAYRKALSVLEAMVARNLALPVPGRDQIIGLYKRFEPKTALAHLTLAQFLYRKPDLESAIANIRQSIRLDPKLRIAHALLVRILMEVADRKNTEAKYLQTLADVDQLATTHPAITAYRFSSAKLHGELGKKYEALGKPMDAVLEFGKASTALAKLDADLPDDKDDRLQLSSAHLELAISLRRLDRQAEAVAEYQRASQILDGLMAKYPDEAKYRIDSTRIHADTGFFCKDTGRLAEAAEEFRHVIRLDPNDPWGHANLGIVLSARGRHQEAIACYAEAVRIEPNNPKFRWEQAMVLRSGGEKQRAIEAAREATRVGPKEVSAFVELGQALQDVGDLDGAISAFQRAVAIDPKSNVAHETLVRLFAKSIAQTRPVADYGKTLAAAKDLSAKFPDHFQYREAEASIHSRMGDLLLEQAKQQDALTEYDRSREILQSLLFIKPDSLSFRSALNKLRFKIGEPASELHSKALNNGHIYRVSFSPDGRWLLAAGDLGTRSPVQIYSARTGELVRTFLPQEDWFWSDARFNRDGTRLVAWGSKGVALYVWDVAAEKLVSKLEGLTKAVTYADFSPDGTQIISGGGDRRLRIWDAMTGRELAVLEGHDDACAGRFCQDDRIISYSLDKTIRGWDVETKRQLWKQSNQSAISTAALAIGDRCLSDDGSRMISRADDGSVHVWETATGQRLLRLAGPSATTGAVFVDGGSRIAAWGKNGWFHIWSVPDGKSTTELKLGNDLLNETDSVTVSPNGRILLTCHKNQFVKIRDLDSGRIHEFAVEARSSTRSPVFSPNSRQAASGSFRGWIYLWNLPSESKDK